MKRKITYISLVLFLIPSISIVPTTYTPPPTPIEPENSLTINQSAKLWSFDKDKYINKSVFSSIYGTTRTNIQELMNGTDYPFNKPPQTVEIWNKNDFREFPKMETNKDVSIYPSGIDTVSGKWIKEAYTEIFSIQPSTLMHISPEKEIYYISPNFSLYGTLDYRIEVPEDYIVEGKRIYWSLYSHKIEHIDINQGNDRLERLEGSHTPHKRQLKLKGNGAKKQTIQLEGLINTTLRKEVWIKVCGDGGCQWIKNIYYPSEILNVKDNILGFKYNPKAGYKVARYPDGDMGVAVFKNEYWRGYKLPKGRVDGVWRFFSARKKQWDYLTYSKEKNETTRPSPLSPLVVHGYPSRVKAYGFRPNDIIFFSGRQYRPPKFEDSINLDYIKKPYNTSYQLVSKSPIYKPSQIKPKGIVRGTDPKLIKISEKQIYKTDILFNTTEINRSHTKITINLKEKATGKPIDLTDRKGYIKYKDKKLKTENNGKVSLIEEINKTDVLTVKYIPSKWWNTPGKYYRSSLYTEKISDINKKVNILFFIPYLGLFILFIYISNRIKQIYKNIIK